LLLGIDLGTSRSSVVSSTASVRPVDSYVGYPKDAVSRKMLKADVIFGKHALDNRLAVELYRPLERASSRARSTVRVARRTPRAATSRRRRTSSATWWN
jgi:rod shape-determining protein MreB